MSYTGLIEYACELKYMMNKNKILAAVVLISLLFGCMTEGDLAKLDHYPISSEFKTYTLFNQGSRWTYEKENTKIQATILVDSVFKYKGVNGLDPDNDVEYKYEAYESFINRPNNMNIKKMEIAATNQSKNYSDMTSLLRLFYNDQYHTIFEPNHQFGEIIAIGDTSGKYVNVEFLAQYTVLSETFSSVYHTRVYDSLYPAQTQIYDFYIAKNFGIIRQEMRSKTDTIIWNLKSWDLYQ